MASPEHPAHLCGWIDDGGHRAIAATMPRLAEAGPWLRAANSSTPVLLYRCWTEVFAAYPDYPAQQIGDCTSFGHGHANDLLQAIEVFLGDLPANSVHQTDTEFLYGEARKEANMLGRQDGCYGAAVVQAMTKVGMVSRAALGVNGTYSGSRAKEWGLTGPPAGLEQLAAGYKLGNGAQVEDWDGLVAAVSNGYPVTVCTARGFTLARDKDGFCKSQGKWGHCMFIAGVRFDRPGACIIQSWGPDSPTGPTALGQPSYSFWADQSAIEAILGEGDSWALSGSPGFAPRSLPGVLSRG
jgi:hypothetical protein